MRRRKVRIAYWVVSVAVLAAAAWSGGSDAAARAEEPFAAAFRGDSGSFSAGGDIALDSAPARDPFAWISDSGIVAIASEMQRPAIEAARLQLNSWISDTTMNLALQIARDHIALREAVDSLAFARRLIPSRPAVADYLLPPYDEQLTSLFGLPARQLEIRFVATQRAAHLRALTDLVSLGGMARDPEVKALLLTRAVRVERDHLARLDLWARERQKGDSIAAAAAAERRSRRR